MLSMTYRQGIQEHSQKQQHEEQDDDTNEDPFESAPHNEFHCLAWVCEPKEGGVWSAAFWKETILITWTNSKKQKEYGTLCWGKINY